ncbi:MAG: hypothetical protein JWO12_824, partial [Frankiales bacterium]|nr:hypothetical protein [Frankiales bacterium]
MTETPDLRLGLPAAAAWITAWQGRLLPPAVLGLGGLALLVVSAVVLCRSQRSRALVLAATLVCAAAAGFATAARVHARTHGALADAAARQAAVKVHAVLLEDPRAVPPKANVLSFQQLVVAKV